MSTIQLCDEIGLSRDSVNKLRRDGVLIPGRDFYSGYGIRAPMFWSVDSVVQALRSRTALAET